MSLADRIAVMNFAVLQQFDMPDEVYRRPKNLFVANFIGSPTMNFLAGTYRDGEIHLNDFHKGKIQISPKYRSTIDQELKHEKVVLGIRPEHLKIEEADVTDEKSLKAEVVSFEPLGSETIVYLRPHGSGDNIIKSMMHSDYVVSINDTKILTFSEEDLYLFDEKSTDLVLKF